MSNNPYFLTNDLEVTSGIPKDKLDWLEDIRKQTISILNNAFSNEVCISVIPHNIGVEFFEEQRINDSFTIAADGWIYVENPDIAFDSTRMYPDERGILENKKWYSILTRDGKKLESQKILIPYEKRQNIGLYDDWLFSGDTLRAILANLPNGVTKYRVNVLLNFSGLESIWSSQVNSFYTGNCVDWIDERDFFYGVEKSGASIFPGGIVSGVPYISSPKMVSEKGSIPKDKSKEFCLKMLQVNKQLWQLIDENRQLWDVPRLAHLLKNYTINMSIIDVLSGEEKRIQSTY